MINIISKWADKLILIYLLTPAEFAVFFNGSIEIPVVGIIIGMTGNYMMMQMTKTFSGKDAIITVFKENYLLLSSFVFPLFFFLFFFKQDLFLIFFGEKYLSALPIFTISIMVLPFRINHFGGILQIHLKGNIVTRGALLDLIIAVSLIFVFYHIWGMRGAVLAPVISTIIQSIFYLDQSAKILGTKIFRLIPGLNLIIRFLLTGMIFLLLASVVKNYSPIISIIVGILTAAGLSLAFGHTFIFQIFSRQRKN